MLKVLNQKDLIEILPFGISKVREMLQNGIIPATKIGRDYIITEEKLVKWIDDNAGKEVYWYMYMLLSEYR